MHEVQIVLLALPHADLLLCAALQNLILA